MSKIPALKDKVIKQAKSPALGEYVWKYGAGPQMGYSFSVIHALAYSFIGAQTLYLATHWNPIYWNTACLIINSASLTEEEDDEVEDDDKRVASTDYGKTAKALGDIIQAGIKVGLVDINKSEFGFKPDVANNQILFGLKALLNVSDDTANEIIANRPYTSVSDFIQKVKPGKKTMVSLIKAGAFDKFMDRKICMAWFIKNTCEMKEKLTLQNMSTLLNYNLIPDDGNLGLSKRVYEFNRYLKTCCFDKINNTYYPDDRALNFLSEIECLELCEQTNTGAFSLNAKVWDKVYQRFMDTIREFLTNNKALLNKLNDQIFLKDWMKYASGNISSWEMETLCFYYHDHELKNVNPRRYGFADFYSLPQEPIIDKTFIRRGKECHTFKLSQICGTCIAKNKIKSIVTILTTTGVVNVKFRKEYFSMFDKQISARDAEGKKHVLEKSWFNRGNMIVVTGIRSGDDFITKNYSNSNVHQLYKIDEITPNNELVLRTERYKGEEEDETDDE